MPGRAADRPNVVYLDCHDLGDWLGCYDRPYLPTPHLDRLAAGGARFTCHTATAPICMPSRASIFTGLMPHQVGVTGQEALAPEAACMAARLRGAGYRTVLCGRLMILNEPAWVGFSEHLAADDDAKAAAAAAFIAAHRPGAGPFLLSVSFQQCHRPFGARHEPALAERVAVPPYLPDTSATRRDLATLAWQIGDLDRRVGQILSAIDRAGLRDTTLVVFTTEHGPALARAKHTTYESGLRTALLLRLPGVIRAGGAVPHLTSHLDLLPTVAELCGLPPPDAASGLSWAPHLAGDRAAPTRQWAFSEFNWGRRSGQWYYTPSRTVRGARYKLMRSYRRWPIYVDNGWLARYAGARATVERWYGAPLPETQLFDLQADPHELRNLAGTPALAPLQAQMDAVLDDHLRATDDPILRGPVANRAGEPDVPQWQRRPDGRFRLAANDPTDPGEASFT